jgi:hypothetical protein
MDVKLTLREELRLGVREQGSERVEVAGECMKLHDEELICTHSQVSLGRDNKGELGGQGRWPAEGEGRKVYKILVRM